MKDLWTKWGDGFLTILFIVLLITTVVVYISDGNLWAIQVLSACLGAIITIIATRLLLSKQSDLENKRDIERREADEREKRDFEIYNAKLKVYSKFVSQMYQFLSDGKVEEPEILDLRTQIFGQVSFYAKKDILELINDELKEKNYTDTQQMQRTFANIASILQKDLREDWPVNPKSSYELWDTFDELLDKSQGENIFQEKTTKTESLSVEMPIESATSNSLNNCFWHFTMWGSDEQLKALREGIYELNLVEYDGINWRTNLIKQVQKDDLIFLFRSGGWGYMGVYRARGWRIFEFGENKTVETIHIFGEEENVITDEAIINEDLKRSDIYKSKENGATLCSSIIVEPIAFSKDGIGNPGGVYRRTISRYYREYGLKQLARFMAIMDDNNIYNVHNNGEKTFTMGCNKELFKGILASGNIQPAQRDEKGNWV